MQPRVSLKVIGTDIVLFVAAQVKLIGHDYVAAALTLGVSPESSAFSADVFGLGI